MHKPMRFCLGSIAENTNFFQNSAVSQCIHDHVGASATWGNLLIYKM